MVLSQLPYFTGSYFTPDYFPTMAAAQPARGEEDGRYFARTYFAPDYFAPYGLIVPPGGLGPEAPYRDRDGLLAITRLLQGTGEFRRVVLGAGIDRMRRAEGSTPAACVTPRSWSEAEEATTFSVVRTVEYDLTIATRSDDFAIAYDVLDRLANLASNLLGYADLGGTSMPALSAVRRGKLAANDRFPELQMTLEGEFSYLVPTRNSHSIQF